jgi:hypothetical protein
MTGLDFNRALAAHFGLPTAQVDAIATKLHHGIGEDLAVTVTINLTPLDLQNIGLIAAGQQAHKAELTDILTFGGPGHVIRARK